MHALYPQPASDMTAEDREDEAWERREQWIADHAPARAKALLSEPDFAWTAIGNLSRDVLVGMAEDLGRFYERYRAAQTDTGEGEAGYPLYLTLNPYVEAAALEQATTEVAAQYDADMAQMERNAA